ncbi:MAG: hypothetical protein MJZ66_04435 [Bacteroidales bacterium]|nr:hypothetical protein [Bacteroidales bacterium]
MNFSFKKIALFAMGVAMIGIQSCSKEVGTLNGEFSVSETKKVKFSQGNLRCQLPEQKWFFADNQYEFVSGDANKNVGYKDFAGGVIDIFAFTGAKEPEARRCEYPCEFVDFGTNVIENGGNEGKSDMWRTLTGEEWAYILFERPDAASKSCYAYVGDNAGIIIMPDKFTCPDGVTFKSFADLGVKVSGSVKNARSATINPKKELEDELKTVNKYTVEQFNKLQEAGAVFMPYCGDNNIDVNEQASYWNAPSKDTTYFSSYKVASLWGARGCRPYSFRMAVRLVKDVK